MGLHGSALLTAASTFVLILAGGLVTNTGSGLAVPDWPTTFGYNMFLFPWSGMVGGVFFEHAHRLIGFVVGLLTLILTLWLWMVEPQRWLRRLGVLALGAVIAQAVLGGLRVILLRDALAIIHGILAQAFFGLTVSLAVFTSPGWREAHPPVRGGDASRILGLSILTTGLISAQLALGALLTHAGARLDAHLLFAALIALHVPLLAVRIRRGYGELPGLLRPTAILAALLILQLALGLGSYLARFTSLVDLSPFAVVALPVAHRGFGALMLATCLVLALRTYRTVTPKAAKCQGLPSVRAAA
jgi:cytochrome c oxidase assembly protein subunit 15